MNEPSDAATTPSDPAPRISRGRRAAIAAGAATAVAGAIMVMSAVGATTANADPNDNAKYFVCKYVGTPGVDETLQKGNNPISVSGNAIPETPVVVGSVFGDQQGRSLVIAVDNTGNGGGQGGEPAPDCPATPPGGGSSTPPPPPTSSTVVTTPTETTTATATTTTTATVAGTVTDVVTETQGAAPQVAGPIPAGVNAGLHTTDSNAGLRAWGILLMLLGGAAGLVFGLRPSRGRAH